MAEGYTRFTACSLELSAAYFQSVNSVFLSHKSANSIFSRLFSVQATKLLDENNLLLTKGRAIIREVRTFPPANTQVEHSPLIPINTNCVVFLAIPEDHHVSLLSNGS
jgi:hypothetical protein